MVMSEGEPKLVSEELFAQFRLIYDALSRGDMEPYLAILHDDVEVHQSPDVLGTKGTFRGKQGAIDGLNELAEGFDQIDWNPLRAYDLGDERFLVLLRPKARGAGSGIEVESDVGHLVQGRDGKVVRSDTYIGWDKALEAVGLSEQDANADS